MSVAEKALSVCARCGERFADLSRTSPRTYCYECAPRRLENRRSVVAVRDVAGRPFSIEHFREWCKRLRLAGDKRFVLEQWEDDFVQDLFEGMRQGWLKEAWLIVPEGNGKSTLVAILILYFVEFVEEAAVPVAAASRDQAEIIFRQASGFARRSPLLAGRFRSKPGLREIVFGADEVSRAKIFASDASTGDGIIPVGIEVIDELHRHKDLELYRTWAGKLDKEDALLIVISTAGEPGSEFEDTRAEIRLSAVETTRDGCFGRFVGATSLMHEYAVPEDGDVEDLELVACANPSARITVETLRAKRARPSFALPHWRRLTCNLPTRDVFAAITEAEWFAARTAAEIPADEPIDVGLDLGWRRDTTAVVPLWVRDREYRLFGRATVLEPSPSADVDLRDIQAAFLRLKESNPIRLVVMDPHHGEALAQWLERDLGVEVVERKQTIPLMALDYSRFMEALREGWLLHKGDEAFSRHVLNAVAKTYPRGDTVFERPHKSSTSYEKQRHRVVDALDAAAMVHSTVVAQWDEVTPEPFFAYV